MVCLLNTIERKSEVEEWSLAIDCHNDPEIEFSCLEESGIVVNSGVWLFSQKSRSCTPRTPSTIPFLSLINSELPPSSTSDQSWTSR